MVACCHACGDRWPGRPSAWQGRGCARGKDAAHGRPARQGQQQGIEREPEPRDCTSSQRECLFSCVRACACLLGVRAWRVLGLVSEHAPSASAQIDWHEDKALGSLACVGAEQLKLLAPSGLSPETETTRTFLQGTLPCLVRRPLQRVLDSMLRYEAKLASAGGAALPWAPSFLLEGARGTGKSHTMDAAVLWARARGWRVLHIPAGWDYVNRTKFIYRSKTAEGMFDQPDRAQDLLARALSANSAWMAKVSMASEQGGGRTLAEVAQHGLRTDAAATEASALVVSQLLSQPGPPLLIALDDVNAFFDKSSFDDGRRNTKNYTRAQALSTVALLTHLLAQPPASAVVLAATTASRPNTNRYFERELYESTIASLRKRATLAPYSASELHTVLTEYYRLRMVTPDPALVLADGSLDARYRLYVDALSGAVPGAVRLTCTTVMN